MSVALDLESLPGLESLHGPVPYTRPRLRVVPREAAPEATPARLASVSVLHAPSVAPVPLRLTRRGVAVLAVLTAAVGAALVWAAAVSSPASGTGPAASGPKAVPATVTVRAGDTLWALASRIAPDRDPRVEVADLRRLNHLSNPALTPGQTLRLR